MSKAALRIGVLIALCLWGFMCAGDESAEGVSSATAAVDTFLQTARSGFGWASEPGSLDALQPLYAHRPGSLPELIAVYRNEPDSYTLNHIEAAVQGVSRFFWAYEFPLSDEEEVTMLRNIWEPGIRQDTRIRDWTKQPREDRRRRLLTWWDHRNEFLGRNDIVPHIRVTVGRTRAEFLKADEAAIKSCQRLLRYGLYSLPYLIEIVREDNNPFMFRDFIYLVVDDEMYGLTHQYKPGLAASAWELDLRFPTREAKLGHICRWWGRTQEDYRALPELYEAITLCMRDAHLLAQSPVEDPVRDFLHMMESDDYRNPQFTKKSEPIEKVLRMNADFDGDGEDDVFLSTPQLVDNWKRQIWYVYRGVKPGYRFLLSCALSADNLSGGPSGAGGPNAKHPEMKEIPVTAEMRETMKSEQK